MSQARFVEYGEILQSNFAKGFSIQRFVPVMAVNGERLVVIALKEQGVSEVLLNEDQIVAVTFLDTIVDFFSQLLSLFAPCLCLSKLVIQDQVEGKAAKRRRQSIARRIIGLIGHRVSKQFHRLTLPFQALLTFRPVAKS